MIVLLASLIYTCLFSNIGSVTGLRVTHAVIRDIGTFRVSNGILYGMAAFILILLAVIYHYMVEPSEVAFGETVSDWVILTAVPLMLGFCLAVGVTCFKRGMDMWNSRA